MKGYDLGTYKKAEIDEIRLQEADPDGLYLFMMEGYPYMMTPDDVSDFTGATAQEIRRLLRNGDLQGCQIGVKWFVPKIALLNYLYRRAKDTKEHGTT